MSGMILGVDESMLPLHLDYVFEAGAYAVGATPLLLAAGVKHIVDDCLQNAEKKRVAEKKRLAEWAALVKRQQQENRESAALEELLVASEQKLAAMELGEADKRDVQAKEGKGRAEQARAHMDLGKERLAPARAAVLLAQFASMLAEAPAAFQAAEGDPCGRLEKQHAALAARLAAGEPLDAEDIGGLREAYRETLAAFLATTRARREWREALQTRIETVLDTVLFSEQVALRFSAELTQYTDELGALRVRLAKLCAAGEPDANELGTIERRLETLRGEIDRSVIAAAQRRGVAEAVTRILSEMGYEAVEDFAFQEGESMAVAVMRIPGGEIVRAALHQNRQLAFEVIHERPVGKDADAPLSVSERLHLLRQEKKWCTDAHALFRRMVAEGFQYSVSFEHDLKDNNVKVVVVESAADILRDEEETQTGGAEEKRYLG